MNTDMSQYYAEIKGYEVDMVSVTIAKLVEIGCNDEQIQASLAGLEATRNPARNARRMWNAINNNPQFWNAFEVSNYLSNLLPRADAIFAAQAAQDHKAREILHKIFGQS